NQRTPSLAYTFIPEDNRANKCIKCKKCNEICPQQLDVAGLMALCSKVFDEKQDFEKVFKKGKE
ncbi:MAG: 4Fe-4S dicluster domain-containing protein, partial [Candidatus Cloacimonetes bacterium]|nr:4Fe-4S dicluster domain-containing protein [Candidatus Cloacimonadota bacterium]